MYKLARELESKADYWERNSEDEGSSNKSTYIIRMYFACICYKKETDEDWKCMNISGYLILEIPLEIIRKQLSIIKYKSLSSNNT